VAYARKGVVAVGALPTSPDASDSTAANGWTGNALLAAIGAWLVGVNAAVCSLVGRNPSDEPLRFFARAAVDVTSVGTASARAARPDYSEPPPDQLDKLAQGWAVHLCRMSPPRQLEIIRAVRRRVALLTVDVAYRGEGVRAFRAELFELAEDCDAIVLGRRDLEEVWPHESPREALRLLARRGARCVVMKLGGGAAIGVHGDVRTWIPGFPPSSPAIMPGGDAYAAAFAAAFADNRDLRRAMAWAGAAASAVVESASPLELLNDYGRRAVASRVKVLESQSIDGWRSGSPA
jgi:pfkB family carbohydrate kinase